MAGILGQFSYLRGLLVGTARTSLAGLALTSANYGAAIDILKRRFGKEVTIERAHVNDLLTVHPVFNEKDTVGLRKLYDTVEVHYRGLQALGVNASTYEGIVVPAVLGKLPEAVRLQITRGKNHEEWRMEEILRELLCELELRKEHCLRNERSVIRETDRRKFGGGPPSASALLAKLTLERLCAYCKGEHAHEDCTNVTSVEERRNLLSKHGRCFICARKGHISSNCDSKMLCSHCKRRHHISICTSNNAYQVPRQTGRTINNGACYDVPPNANQSSHASPALQVGSTGRVALQTAQAVISGNKSLRVCVLFDAGSHMHKSFITTRAVQLTGLKQERREWIEISTFGQQARDSGLRGVYEFDVFPLQGVMGFRSKRTKYPV